jgi:CRISPR-associated protein Cas1
MEQVIGVLVSGYRSTITTPAMMAVLSAGITVTYALHSGHTGYAAALSVPNAAVRCRVARMDRGTALRIAMELISAKVANQAARIRPVDPESAKGIRKGRDELDTLAFQFPNSAEGVETLDHIQSVVLGIEGYCAELYFNALFSAVPPWAQTVSVKRVKRGATDPVNSMLNYGYAVLSSTVTRAIVSCGLDPAAGVLHSVTRNPTPLTSDMMEPFRAPVVDSAVRSLLSAGTVTANGFAVTSNGVWVMSKQTRKDVASAVIKQLKTEHNYIADAYAMTWERTVEYQIRTFVQAIDGFRDEWKCVRVR